MSAARAREDDSAVASARARAADIRLDKCDVDPRLARLPLQRGPTSGAAAADEADSRADLALNRRRIFLAGERLVEPQATHDGTLESARGRRRAERTMRSTYWWGVPTFLAAPHDPDPVGCDVALVGVPHSSGNGSTERDQHLGPRAVRHVSAGYRRRHRRFGVVPHDLCRLRDLGDVVMPEF